MPRANSIGFEIKTLANLIKRHVDNSDIKKYVDNMTGTHGWIIGFLYDRRNTEVFQRDLEEQFSIRRSTATAILQLMEKNGLIRREPVERDARLKKLVLTPKAIEIHEIIHDEIERLEEQLSAGLSRRERESFFLIIDKIKNNIAATEQIYEANNKHNGGKTGDD